MDSKIYRDTVTEQNWEFADLNYSLLIVIVDFFASAVKL